MWELTILDANLPAQRLDSLAAADLDGDGALELVTGGDGLFWVRPRDRAWGRISPRYAHVGVVVGDIDGDGKPEVIVGEGEALPDKRAELRFGGAGIHSRTKDWSIAWYKPGADLRGPWATGLIDPRFEGHVHDILLADIDGDGTRELIAISCYSDHPGIFILKPGRDPHRPWTKHAVSEGIFTEGLSIGDLDGDGRLEIVCGPDWYKAPLAGPLSGHWTRHTFA
ncbi:MAG TPA: VCBS repeat-containing protein, partial [Spirochaetia bacterium]|nr:VCBS repeat-containing protein [Spirochaetia bacterium]